MRKIPATMATQHPDNANAPYWEKNGDGFVSTYEELDECMSAWRDLGVDEFMWDWEGKYADEAVIDKLFSLHYDFFKKNQLGKDKFLTFRLPNIWHEKGYSLLRALMVILTSQDFARDLNFYPRPLFEVILPMVVKAEQPIYIQDCFKKLARFKSKNFKHRADGNDDYLEIIPLVESVKNQIGMGRLLKDYVELHKKHFRQKPLYMRPFLARSDPALCSGMVANVLANKIALSEIYAFADEKGIKMYPIIGAGSLIFRGGLEPQTIKSFIAEYSGVRTVTIQSAFRYDYPFSQAKQAIKYLNNKLAESEVERISAKHIRLLKNIISKFERNYQITIGKIAKDLEIFFGLVPRRRERRLHIGFLSYKRKVGKNHLPRAIGFCCAFYSIGIPPELIGLGRAFKSLSEQEIELVKKYYINLLPDLIKVGRYLNRDNLRSLVKNNKAWELIEKDIKLVEEVLGIKLGPKTQDDWLHKNLTSNVLLLKNRKEKVRQLMIETGKIRLSLG